MLAPNVMGSCKVYRLGKGAVAPKRIHPTVDPSRISRARYYVQNAAIDSGSTHLIGFKGHSWYSNQGLSAQYTLGHLDSHPC